MWVLVFICAHVYLLCVYPNWHTAARCRFWNIGEGLVNCTDPMFLLEGPMVGHHSLSF